MPETNPFLVFTRRFEEIGVRYRVTGSVAATVYGEPRLPEKSRYQENSKFVY